MSDVTQIVRTTRSANLISSDAKALVVRTTRGVQTIKLDESEQVITRQGEPGVSLEYNWAGTSLGVRKAGESDFVYRELGVYESGGGYAVFFDETYTNASPLLIDTTPQTLKIDAASSILSYAGPGAANWWDETTNRFRPDVIGSSFDFRVNFLARPLVANRDIRLELDIGGALGVIWGADRTLSRQAGVAVNKAFDSIIYCLDTFVANGGRFLISATGPVEIFDLSLVFRRAVL